MRPHQRRSAQGSARGEDDPFGHITPPTLDTIEALEKAFPVTLFDARGLPAGTPFAEVTFGETQRMLGQQDVLQFLRNLSNQARGE